MAELCTILLRFHTKSLQLLPDLNKMLSTSTTTSVVETTVTSKTTESYLVDNSSTVHPDDDTDLSPKNQPISFIIAPLCAVGIICFITAMVSNKLVHSNHNTI